MKQILTIFLTIFLLVFISGCNNDENKKQISGLDGVENSPEKDAQIQKYNLEQQKKLAGTRTPCDTLALKEYVLQNYQQGSYLVNFDKLFGYSLPKPALIYFEKDRRYIFAVVAKSREGERLIEPQNIVGYDQSFIDLDSTELGTAYFYLTLFKCDAGSIEKIWESLIPSHGGFNRIILRNWRYKGTPFIETNFHYGRGTGHINYNYFLIDGVNKKPHLLMTYEGINFKRTVTNYNNDKYPDYYEHIYYDLGDRIYSKDSVAFVWNEKDSVYVNTKNNLQTRPY
ncbi:hypothetical protein ACFLSS_02295 [Bacteroidota bacterium]